jgi:hypothetical protein
MLYAGQFPDAERIAREALDLQAKHLPDGWERFNAASLLGAALLAQRRYPEAEPLLREGYEGLKARVGTFPGGEPWVFEAGWTIGRLYEETGRPGQANGWRKQLGPEPAPRPRVVRAAATTP